MVRQVKFRVIDEEFGDPDEIFGGIAIFEDDANLVNVICGGCGDMFEPEDVEIIEIYEHYWVNLSDEILGDDRD